MQASGLLPCSFQRSALQRLLAHITRRHHVGTRSRSSSKSQRRDGLCNLQGGNAAIDDDGSLGIPVQAILKHAGEPGASERDVHL